MPSGRDSLRRNRVAPIRPIYYHPPPVSSRWLLQIHPKCRFLEVIRSRRSEYGSGTDLRGTTRLTKAFVQRLVSAAPNSPSSGRFPGPGAPAYNAARFRAF